MFFHVGAAAFAPVTSTSHTKALTRSLEEVQAFAKEPPILFEGSFHSPRLNRTVNFLSADEANHIVSMLPARNSSEWSSCTCLDFQATPPELCALLPLAQDPMLSAVLARLKGHLENMLQLPVDVSRMSHLPIQRLVPGDAAAQELHRDLGSNLQLAGLPNPEITIFVTLTNGVAISKEGDYEGGSTQFLADSIDGTGPRAVSFTARRGAILTFDPMLPHKLVPLDTGERFVIGIYGIGWDGAFDGSQKKYRCRVARACTSHRLTHAAHRNHIHLIKSHTAPTRSIVG